MLGNGRQVSIHPSQIGVYSCPECKDAVFKPISCVQFVYDKLKPSEMKPAPCTLYQCLGCEGYLQQKPDKSYVVVHRQSPPLPGDEWKKLE